MTALITFLSFWCLNRSHFSLEHGRLGVPELNGHMEKPSHYMGNFHCFSWIPPKKSPALRHAPATECQCAKPKNEASKLLVYTFQVWRFMIGFATLIKLVQTARWKKWKPTNQMTNCPLPGSLPEDVVTWFGQIPAAKWMSHIIHSNECLEGGALS